MDQKSVEEFIEDYRTTFEAMDAAAITARFTFPCQVIGEADGVTIASVPDAAVWAASISRIVGAYQLLGVASAGVESLRVVELTAGTAHAVVEWQLRRASGDPVYSFTASYTVVDTGAGARIAAIVHDEGPKLAAAVAAASAGRPA